MVASVDIANRYNKIQCKLILKAVWECPDLCGMYLFFHKILSLFSYVRLGGGSHIITAPFTCYEGIQQGAIKASFLFCAGTNKANQTMHQGLLDTGGGLKAGMDDTYLCGLLDWVVTAVVTQKEVHQGNRSQLQQENSLLHCPALLH
eukprot:5480834-Ditylum_brightwellii.AAC.1